MITVIRHVEIEDLGYLGQSLADSGVAFRYVDAGGLIEAAGPGEKESKGLVVLGGPMAAYEADRHPYLQVEIELIRYHLDCRRPVLGVCLGAQLLAAAAGARVYRGAAGKEIGWREVQLTAAGVADPLWAGFPERFTTFHWHGDTFDIPEGAEPLAWSDSYLQAFRLGAHAYGVQFHPEVVPERLDSWVRAYRLELEREQLSSESVLAVPDRPTHRALAILFGRNLAQWLMGNRSG